ncbi:hypothetical protein [Aquabacter cavernae]|uniref:hypothetical protein n=1 Tax=Aquabacter cavernae TaxID=2496029 RepID=UPI000F8EAAD6|nr:hypothetical protein [Aquabacter cavernae]
MLRSIASVAALCLSATAAFAEQLPVPQTDFALKAKVQQGVAMELAQSGGRLRIHLSGGKMPAPVLGIIDLKRYKMLMMLPDIPKAAVEAEVPPAYRTAFPRGEGEKIGVGQAAGEACDVWRVEKSADLETPAFVCITADGIPLRTEVESKGKKQLVYEATFVSRAPQSADLFAPPPGTQIMKVPPGAANLLPGLGKLLKN